jgi:prophage regulatory protein
MSSAPINKSSVRVQLREKASGQPIRPRQLMRQEESLKGTPAAPDDVTFLRLPGVKAVTGLSKTSIYQLIREKSFPTPVHLGPRAVAWVRSEVRQWAVDRVHASRSAD